MILYKKKKNCIDNVKKTTANAMTSIQNNWEYSIIPNRTTIRLPNDKPDNSKQSLRKKVLIMKDKYEDVYYYDDESLPVGASMEEIQDVNESIPKLSNLSLNNSSEDETCKHDYYHPSLHATSSSLLQQSQRLSSRKYNDTNTTTSPIGSSYQEIKAINVNVQICNKLLAHDPKVEDMGDILQVGQRDHHLSYEFLSEIYREAFMRDNFYS